MIDEDEQNRNRLTNTAGAGPSPAEKKHSPIFKVWRVIYPLFIFLGIQFVAAIGIALYYTVTVILPEMSQGFDIAALTKQMTDWVTGQTLLIALICNLTILPLFAFLYFRQMKGKRRPALSSFKVADYLLVAVLAIFANLTVSYIITGFDIVKYFPDYQLIMEGIQGPIILQIISVGIIAPIAEEFLMRGVVLNRLLGYVRVLPALFIQAALFGILHLNLLQGMYAGVLALLRGYIYLKYGSLLMTILFHITMNTLSIVIPESFAEGVNPFVILIVSAVLTAGTIMLINRRKGSVMFISDMKLENVPHKE